MIEELDIGGVETPEERAPFAGVECHLVFWRLEEVHLYGRFGRCGPDVIYLLRVMLLKFCIKPFGITCFAKDEQLTVLRWELLNLVKSQD